MNKLILLSLLAVLAPQQPKQRGGYETPPPTARSLHCTPAGIRVSGGALEPVQNSIAAALQRAAPGALIELEAGVYKGFSSASTSRSTGTRAPPADSPDNR